MQSWMSTCGLFVGLSLGMMVPGKATGEGVVGSGTDRMIIGRSMATYRIDRGLEEATLYDTGESVETSWVEIWKPMCGPGSGVLTVSELKALATSHDAELAGAAPGEIIVVDTPQEGLAGAGINIIFTLGSSVPSAAVPAFAKAEAYLESVFADPISVTVSVTFQNMGSGVLGSTSSFYTTTSYTTARNSLNTNKESGDVIQSWLPTGSTVPVRFNGSSATVSQVSTIWWTKAAYKSTVGSVLGNAGSMTFNTAFPWDYDPTNGVGGNQLSLVDVIIHEVGHALGFTSAVDWSSNSVTVLDLFRFQATDGSADYNPDTYAEFQVRPRLVSYNSPNDQHLSDVIVNEWKMSDGSPWQGSHFREQPATIGLMDPAFSYGQTFYPNYFSLADLSMFDAIGYNW